MIFTLRASMSTTPAQRDRALDTDRARKRADDADKALARGEFWVCYMGFLSRSRISSRRQAFAPPPAPDALCACTHDRCSRGRTSSGRGSESRAAAPTICGGQQAVDAIDSLFTVQRLSMHCPHRTRVRRAVPANPFRRGMRSLGGEDDRAHFVSSSATDPAMIMSPLSS